MSDTILGHTVMDPAAFLSDRVLQWLVTPFMPEHFEDFTLPIMVDDMTMVVSVRGMVLPVYFPDEGVLTVSGYTSKFHSRFNIKCGDGLYRFKGNYNGETIDYSVQMAPSMMVEGDTGKNRANYAIDLAETELHVHGNVSGARSDYRIALKPEAASIKGNDRGDIVRYEVTCGAEGWRWRGVAAKGPLDLTAVVEGNALVLSGIMYQRRIRLVFESKDGVLHVLGSNNWGPVDMTVTFSETSYRVVGRADHHRVDYQVSTAGEVMDSGYDALVRPIDPYNEPTARIDVRGMFRAPATAKMDASVIAEQMRLMKEEAEKAKSWSQTQVQPEVTEAEPFRRSIGLLTLTALGLNSVIGTGIFASPGQIAAALGSWGIVAFALGGVLCYAIALCFAEMAARWPETGGAYAYARVTFGPLVGYLVGWVIWLSSILGWAAVVVLLADLIISLAGLTTAWHPALVVSIVIALSGLNWLGARLGSASNEGLAALKMVPLVYFMLWCLPRLGHQSFGTPTAHGWSSGFLMVLYAFSGFEEIPVPAGETTDPQRTIPRALAVVLGVSTVVYMVFQAAVVPLGVSGSDLPFTTAAQGIPWLLGMLSLASLASIASVNASIAFTGPRSLWALTHDRWPWLAALHPTFNTPSRAILLNAAAVLALALTNGFAKLAALSVLASLLQYLPTVLAVLIWQRREDSREGFRIPFGPVIPVLALLVCLLLLGTSERDDLQGAAEALGLGLLLYLASRGRRSDLLP